MEIVMSECEYLYRIQPTRPEMLSEGLTPEEESVVGEHFTYLQELTARVACLSWLDGR